jgi:predicted DCC family thiol-disulfide oxidoreductase YuxK
MPTLGTLTLEDAAEKAAGNWQRFDSFVWFRDHDVEDADRWAIIYTHNRDSGLLDQSNAAVIAKAMAPFAEEDEPTVVFESHSHWLVGHVDGFSLRVFDGDGEITEAFRKYHELAEAMDDYPILDESDYSERELEATLENIEDAAWRLKNEFELPKGWVWSVYDWLSENRSGEVENRDDQGGYPSEKAMRDAFESLDFKSVE